jgi:hypothetical protein
MAQSDAVVALAALEIVAARGTAGFRDTASARPTPLVMSIAAVVAQSIRCSGRAAFGALRCSAASVNSIDRATGIASLPPVRAAGTAVINGRAMSGGATVLPLSVVGTGAMFTDASALVSVGVMITVDGHLWLTPLGFVQGEDVVHWNA